MSCNCIDRCCNVPRKTCNRRRLSAHLFSASGRVRGCDSVARPWHRRRRQPAGFHVPSASKRCVRRVRFAKRHSPLVWQSLSRRLMHFGKRLLVVSKAALSAGRLALVLHEEPADMLSILSGTVNFWQVANCPLDEECSKQAMQRTKWCKSYVGEDTASCSTQQW
jgi:hypothetical protein